MLVDSVKLMGKSSSKSSFRIQSKPFQESEAKPPLFQTTYKGQRSCGDGGGTGCETVFLCMGNRTGAFESR